MRYIQYDGNFANLEHIFYIRLNDIEFEKPSIEFWVVGNKEPFRWFFDGLVERDFMLKKIKKIICPE